MIKLYYCLITAVSCLLFTSCDKIEEILPIEIKEKTEEGFTTYIIPANNHFTSNNFGIVTSNKLHFLAKLDDSAIYSTVDKANQADINKLYGFSDCSTDHQSNSARFGWRWYNNQLEILAYTYVNKIRKESFISTVDVNKAYEYELETTDSTYIFKLNGKIVTMERGCTGNSDKYKLFPYFGGDETAPHEIKIVIKEL